ncbi:Glycosyltransferase, GT2 family [Methylorubrum salsuginis]|uniref:Glycosyltransferase, GT2 family n=1 Tax=Methylorubrum salsuginis TaxID=414703 RepID=A0A1I4ETY4_9HYPH|nr:Glycosyltransferase, GT2 family [Methylorubrum salsuginis]
MTIHRDQEDAKGHVASYKICPDKTIEFMQAGASQIEASVILRDRYGFEESGVILSRRVLDRQVVNHLVTSDKGLMWRFVETPTGARIGKNVRNWTLSGSDTYFIFTENDVAAERPMTAVTRLFDPLNSDDLAVEADQTYLFTALVATHRCDACFVFQFLDAAGRVVHRQAHDVATVRKGGTRIEDYHPLRVRLDAPGGARRLRILIEKGASTSQTNSYFFFANPSLAEVEDAVVLSSEFLRLAREDGPARIVAYRAKLPLVAFESRKGSNDIAIVIGGHEHVIKNAISYGFDFKISEFRVKFDQINVTVSRSSTNHPYVKLDVCVDDTPIRQIELLLDAEQISHSIKIDSRYFDGQYHVVSIRNAADDAVLHHTTVLLDFQMTPWTALQTYAKKPFDATLSSLAAFHLKSYRQWHRDPRDAARIPNLYALQETLLDGIRKRAKYRPIAFPAVETPDVSIVIPLHNKFEVTYLCLSALLFAYTAYSFEVILVDDGSTDETVAIAETVTGVTCLRNPTAKGFVESCNRGAAAARGRYTVFLNNDTEVTANWLDELIHAYEDFDDVGLVGSKLIYPDGTLQEAGGVIWDSGNPWNYGRNQNNSDPKFNYLRQADYVSGAALLIDSELLRQIGYFSREFIPGYFEDTDLAMKVRHAGKRVLYVPSSVVVHYEGQSSGTDVTSGMKKYQEVNRPKFKKKWVNLFKDHGREGVNVDREKDRHVRQRMLVIDNHYPMVDNDAGSYAAFQEIRLFQSLGMKVTFLPLNLAFMDRHTRALQKIGVECLYAPFVTDISAFIRDRIGDFDLVYVTRYYTFGSVISLIREHSRSIKVILNLADLHFLREMRAAKAQEPNYTLEGALETKRRELEMIAEADLTLSYSDVELTVLESHLPAAKLGRVPWVVDVRGDAKPTFADTKDILFLGGFGHPPNVEAARFFVTEVMPELLAKDPSIVFHIVGSNPTKEVMDFASDSVKVHGYVPDLDAVLSSTRVFVAPLRSGAGIKGKVLESLSYGLAGVFSPIAIEGTGLSNELDCLVADEPRVWAAQVLRLYSDEALWERISAGALERAKRFSFEHAREDLQKTLATVDIYTTADGLRYKRVRPRSYE